MTGSESVTDRSSDYNLIGEDEVLGMCRPSRGGHQVISILRKLGDSN